MHFTYSSTSSEDLSQGDVLDRNPEFEAILEEVHPHYSDPKNTHFMVLTQTCDLVRRGGNHCNARYISIAAVRRLSTAYERELYDKRMFSYKSLPPIADTKAKSSLDLFLHRLFNNNEPNYFFLSKEPTVGLPSHSCAFLRLSIALKAEIHYQTLLGCRILQLDEPFQAKLGWLVGQLYSRVATQDWPPDELRKQVKNTHDEEAIWVDPRRAKRLKREIEKEIENNGEDALGEVEIEDLIKKLPTRKEEVLERIQDVIGSTLIFSKLKEDGHLSDQALPKLINALRSDQALTTLLQ